MRRIAWLGLLLAPALIVAGEDPPTRPGPPDSPPKQIPPSMPTIPPNGEWPESSPARPRPEEPTLPAPRVMPGSSGLLVPPPPVPPSPEVNALKREAVRLRLEREALALDREKAANAVASSGLSESAETTRLRLRLAELLAKLSTQTLAPKMRPPEPPPTLPPPLPTRNPAIEPSPEISMARPTKSGDPLLVAQSLFRAGDFAGSLQNYRKIDPDSLTREERVLVQYMSACCQRKLGKLEDAAALYREVANGREDEILTDCALWHLNALNWRRDLQKQLEETRQRRQAH